MGARVPPGWWAGLCLVCRARGLGDAAVSCLQQAHVAMSWVCSTLILHHVLDFLKSPDSIRFHLQSPFLAKAKTKKPQVLLPLLQGTSLGKHSWGKNQLLAGDKGIQLPGKCQTRVPSRQVGFLGVETEQTQHVGSLSYHRAISLTPVWRKIQKHDILFNGWRGVP